MANPMTPAAIREMMLEMRERAETIESAGRKRAADGILDAIAGEILRTWPATADDASAIAATLAEQRVARADGSDAVARAILPFALKRISEAS